MALGSSAKTACEVRHDLWLSFSVLGPMGTRSQSVKAVCNIFATALLERGHAKPSQLRTGALGTQGYVTNTCNGGGTSSGRYASNR
jgi:hypothetical protein